MKNIIMGIGAIILLFNAIYFVVGSESESKICKDVYRIENIDESDLTCQYICDFTKQIGQNVHKAALAQKMFVCYEEIKQQPCDCGEM